MSNKMETIIITILFILTLAFLYFWQEKRDKAEQQRFREFVMASKSKDVEDYVHVLPSVEDTPVIKQEELMNVEDVDAHELLEAIKQQHENN